MSTTFTNQTIADLVTEQPSRSRVFESLGIDYCCGGRRPLEQACADKGLAPAEVIERLRAEDAARSTETDVDYGAMSLTELIDHILDTHHAYLRTELPRLIQITQKVAQAHADAANAENLTKLADQVRDLTAELDSHMMKEERILFPAIKRMDSGEAGLTIDGPVAVMMQEHDDAGRALTNIRTLTDNFTLPDYGCNTYRAMLDALLQLEQDLHIHIHKENNVLFPRAQARAES